MNRYSALNAPAHPVVVDQCDDRNQQKSAGRLLELHPRRKRAGKGDNHPDRDEHDRADDLQAEE
jgi:hypothetical protein